MRQYAISRWVRFECSIYALCVLDLSSPQPLLRVAWADGPRLIRVLGYGINYIPLFASETIVYTVCGFRVQ